MRDFLGGCGALHPVSVGYHLAPFSTHKVPNYPTMYLNSFLLLMSVNVPSDIINWPCLPTMLTGEFRTAVPPARLAIAAPARKQGSSRESFIVLILAVHVSRKVDLISNQIFLFSGLTIIRLQRYPATTFLFIAITCTTYVQSSPVLYGGAI
ncbi:hypothetical protein N431DRAFT_429587 [Stipitochalara longipes BDJ]|nr:hypothetical protein N431DRAFT_429587 [Stipitochalara longipes BDJ]